MGRRQDRYDKHILPIVKQLCDLCQEHKVPFFGTCILDDDGAGNRASATALVLGEHLDRLDEEVLALYKDVSGNTHRYLVQRDMQRRVGEAFKSGEIQLPGMPGSDQGGLEVISAEDNLKGSN